MAFVFSALWCAITLSERFLVGVLFGQWSVGWWDFWIFLPLNLWFSAILATIFRFLSYLDARIRLEGWEVESGSRRKPCAWRWLRCPAAFDAEDFKELRLGLARLVCSLVYSLFV